MFLFFDLFYDYITSVLCVVGAWCLQSPHSHQCTLHCVVTFDISRQRKLVLVSPCRSSQHYMILMLIFIPVFKESYYNITINYSYNAAAGLNPFKIFLSETVDKVRHSTWYVSVVTVLDIMLGSSSIRSLVQCLAPG